MGHAECVKLLLDAGASALAAVDVAGSSALAEACRAGSFESVRLLLLNPAARVLVNRADMMGRTPLMTACAAGVAEIGELLIRAGADLTAEDRNARTAMHWAASQGRVECLVRLLGRGFPPNHGGSRRATALHVAVQCDEWPSAEALLEGGADPFVCDQRGRRPRDLANATNAARLRVWEQATLLRLALSGAAQSDSPLRNHFASAWLFDARPWRVVARFV